MVAVLARSQTAEISQAQFSPLLPMPANGNKVSVTVIEGEVGRMRVGSTGEPQL